MFNASQIQIWNLLSLWYFTFCINHVDSCQILNLESWISMLHRFRSDALFGDQSYFWTNHIFAKKERHIPATIRLNLNASQIQRFREWPPLPKSSLSMIHQLETESLFCNLLPPKRTNLAKVYPCLDLTEKVYSMLINFGWNSCVYSPFNCTPNHLTFLVKCPGCMTTKLSSCRTFSMEFFWLKICIIVGP